MPRQPGTITPAFLWHVGEGHVLHVYNTAARHALNWVTRDYVDPQIRAALAGVPALVQMNPDGVAYELTVAGRRRLEATTEHKEGVTA